jgi:hypothetical protein
MGTTIASAWKDVVYIGTAVSGRRISQLVAGKLDSKSRTLAAINKRLPRRLIKYAINPNPTGQTKSIGQVNIFDTRKSLMRRVL